MSTAEERRPPARRLAVLGGCVVLSAVFLAAALPKIIAPQQFARALYQFHLLPDGAISVTAIFLPWLECVTGIALLLPRARDAAAAVMSLMLLVFSGALAANLLRGIEAPCGCFAILGNLPATWWHVMANVIWAGVASGIAFHCFTAEPKFSRFP